jgi:hypothetical protein
MIKLKELVNDVLNEFDFTPNDLKKFNRIMNGELGVKSSIHYGEDGELDFAKGGFGYGGPSYVAMGKKSPDRPYRSDKDTVGGSKVQLTPEI